MHNYGRYVEAVIRIPTYILIELLSGYTRDTDTRCRRAVESEIDILNGV